MPPAPAPSSSRSRTIWRWVLGPLSLRRLAFSILEIYLAVLILAWFFADRLAHHPPPGKYGPLPGEIRLTTSDGIPLVAVWMPQKKAASTILLSHGNAEDLARLLPYLDELRGAGFQVLAYDYRGYGRSAGHPTEAGLYHDIEAAYRYLTDALHLPPSQILVLGRSLGSGPSTWLAATHPVGGLILESAFTSAFRVALPIPLFPFDQFPNLQRMPKIHCPVLVIHGTDDTLIPMAHGQKLYAAIRGKKSALWVKGATHNDVFATDPELYLQTLRNFSEMTRRFQDSIPR